MLRVNNLEQRRNKTFCLKVDRLRVKSGNILCIAGPNGSGKTTLIECLAGALILSKGSIEVAGQTLNPNLYLSRSLIGYIPDDEDWFIKELCADEYFNLLSRIYEEVGISRERMEYRCQQLARALHFNNFRQQLQTLSHGNKRKVQIIAGLIHQPKLIVIDELRNGLDPLAVIAAEQVIRAEAERGACIVAATHDLWWAERMSHQTLILIEGQVAIHDSTTDILEQYGSLERLFIQLAEKKTSKHAAV